MTRRAGILGVGVVGPLRHDDDGATFLELSADALVAAAADAAVERHAINGMVVNSGGDAGPDYDQLAAYLGLDIGTALQSWAHGRFSASTVYQAALLVRDGLADVVACIYGRRLAADVVGGPGWKGWVEELRAGGGPHGENPLIGLTAPVGNAALTARLYSHRYGIDLAELHRVVAASRVNASHYPGALRSKPVGLDDYLANPFVTDPLRRWDCTPRTEGAVCILVGNLDAAAAPNRAVDILGFDGVPGGAEEFIWSRPGLGFADQSMLEDPEPDRRVFERAGVGPADVDVFFTYEPFSPLVWFGLERYGYAPPGGAPEFVRDNGLTFDSSFPTNTHGGSLGAGQLAGWLHLAEAVTQLRGEGGSRQVVDAQVAHYGPCFGDSIILGRR